MTVAGPPPIVGTFLITRRGIVSFLWAAGWFVFVFLGLLSFELTSFDPLSLAAPVEPDGVVDGIRWWRQSVVVRVMLTVMRGRTSGGGGGDAHNGPGASSSSVASLEAAAAKKATAGQSLLAMKTVGGGGRSQQPDVFLDVYLSRKIWRPLVVPNVGALAGVSRLLGWALGDEENGVEVAAGGGYDRSALVRSRRLLTGQSHGSSADMRMPPQCSMLVHVDSGAAQLGSELSGGFATKRSPQLSEKRGAASAASLRLLFEGFIYCGNQRDTPASIARRVEEYFESCGRRDLPQQAKNKKKEGADATKSTTSSFAVTCVSPGLMALLLLQRRVMAASLLSSKKQQQQQQQQHESHLSGFDEVAAAAATMDRTRAVFLDIGAGSEIMSTIAVSALHGYRQSGRLARTREFHQAAQKDNRLDDNNNNNNNNKADFTDQVFTQAVVSPPALVVPVEMATDYSSPLELTKACDAVPSNSKLFFSPTVREPNLPVRRRDCNGADPDRVMTVALNAAVGPDPAAWTGTADFFNPYAALEPSTFYSMRTHVAARDSPTAAFAVPPAFTSSLSPSSPSSVSFFPTSPRVFQCFAKEQVPQSAFVGKSQASQNLQADAKAVRDLKHEFAHNADQQQQQQQQRKQQEKQNINDNRNDGNEQQETPDAIKKRKQDLVDRLPSMKQWQDIRDRDWNSRLAPHARVSPSSSSGDSRSANKNQQMMDIMMTNGDSIFPSQRHGSSASSAHFTKMHPLPLLSVLDQVRSIASRASFEEELGGARATQLHTFVGFADVAGHDAAYLDCGQAVSQSEMMETVADAAAKLGDEERKTAPTGMPSLEVVAVLRPISLSQSSPSKSTSSSSSSTQTGSDEFSGSCSACSAERARRIADETVAALARARAVIISGCGTASLPISAPSDENEDRANAKKIMDNDGGDDDDDTDALLSFIPITKDSSAYHAVRAFLLHLDGESTLPGGGTVSAAASSSSVSLPFCAVWFSTSANDAVHSPQQAPTSQELDALRMSVLERLDDDAKAGLVTSERRAVTKGLTSDEDDEESNNNDLRNRHAAALSSSSTAGWFNVRGIFLLAVAGLVAFFLIRGICRNFSFFKRKPSKPKD